MPKQCKGLKEPCFEMLTRAQVINKKNFMEPLQNLQETQWTQPRNAVCDPHITHNVYPIYLASMLNFEIATLY